jgi:hypothetical protein
LRLALDEDPDHVEDASHPLPHEPEEHELPADTSEARLDLFITQNRPAWATAAVVVTYDDEGELDMTSVSKLR